LRRARRKAAARGLWKMSETEARRSSKADCVYRDLKQSILSGALEPGGAIDKLELCERLGVSRFPVSSAISRLAYERLVTIEPQHGSFVARIAVEDVRERLLVRRALEAEIAAEAALRMPREGLQSLERNLRRQQAAVEARDIAGFYLLDVDFHRLIAAQLGLRHCGEILDGLRSHLERVRRLLLSPAGRLPLAFAEHRAVAEAVSQGDAPAARAAMERHLQQTASLFETFVKERSALFS
jgi:GntR family transcriptional regulator, rspAB operon transcriptional repressor